MKYNRILGFHMTLPEFKLRNNRFFWVSTFMWYYSTLKALCKHFFGSKGFFVLRYRTLEFPGLCVTRHLADGQESSYVQGWKHYRFWEIFLYTHSLSQNKDYFTLYEFLKRRIHALRKLKNRCFNRFLAAILYLCPWIGHKHGVSIRAFNYKFG